MEREQTTGTIADLDALIADAAARAQRPRIVPREAMAQIVQNVAGGIGAGVATAAAMLYFGAPLPVETGVFVAAIFAGTAMAVRSVADEAVNLRKGQQLQTVAKRVVRDVNARLKLACDELDALEAALDNERRAHADTKHALDLARIEIAQSRDQLSKRTNYVAPQQATPQVVTDANRLLSNYYASGEWTSRRKATEPPLAWTEDRYRAACDKLRDAGIIVTRNTRTDVLPADLPTATAKLNSYLLRVDTNRPPVDAYVEVNYDE